MKRIARFIVAAVALFALLPVPAQAAELLIPGGSIIGLRLGSDTITVAAYDETLGEAARSAGLKIGDELVEVDGVVVSSAKAVPELLQGCTDTVRLTVRRGGRLETVQLTPTQTEEGPRLGVYLRQGIAGIGTVTFYDPDTHLFGTLGHGVSDSKGNLLKMTQGSAYTAWVQAVKKGKSGAPGQLKGNADAMESCGELLKNTPRACLVSPGRAGRENRFPPGNMKPSMRARPPSAPRSQGTAPGSIVWKS